MVTSRFKKTQVDIPLAMTTFALVAFGIIMLSSASVIVSYEQHGYNNYYLIRQGIIALIGIVGWFVAQKINYHFWKKISIPFLIFSVILSLCVFIPGLGVEVNGARRWINIGPLPIQPAEILKLSLIMFLSNWFDFNRRNISSLKKSYLPFMALIAIISAVILLQRDMGTLMVIAFFSVAMFFVAGARILHLVITLLVGIIGGGAMIKLEPYRMQRLLVFLDPEKDPLGSGFHINQVLIAVGTGGWFGRGFGKSGQKYTGYIPEAGTDSIFAIIAEELGFLKVVFIPILLFLIFAWRGYYIASNSSDYFGKVLAFGITSWIIFQAVLNIFTMTSLAPLTGIPLPFISYGGTSLIMVLFASGILLNISKHKNI